MEGGRNRRDIYLATIATIIIIVLCAAIGLAITKGLTSVWLDIGTP